jgi:NRPS condensation-like uncharacterized protein
MSSEEVFIFPASFAQQRLWFIDQLIPGNAIYNVPTVIRLTGRLNTSALEQTFKEIVRRHEVLRTTFKVLDGQPLQAISAESCANGLTIPLCVLDLGQLPPDEREREVNRIVNAEIERPFDLSQGPLLRVTLLQLSETEHILLLNMHHIICDDWSIGVLIRELGTLYAAFAQNQAFSAFAQRVADRRYANTSVRTASSIRRFCPLATRMVARRSVGKSVNLLASAIKRHFDATSAYRQIKIAYTKLSRSNAIYRVTEKPN